MRNIFSSIFCALFFYLIVLVRRHRYCTEASPRIVMVMAAAAAAVAAVEAAWSLIGMFTSVQLLVLVELLAVGVRATSMVGDVGPPKKVHSFVQYGIIVLLTCHGCRACVSLLTVLYTKYYIPIFVVGTGSCWQSTNRTGLYFFNSRSFLYPRSPHLSVCVCVCVCIY